MSKTPWPAVGSRWMFRKTDKQVTVTGKAVVGGVKKVVIDFDGSYGPKENLRRLDQFLRDCEEVK